MELPYLWRRLQQAGKPIVLYGMGDGADKILAACKDFAIPVAGIFASDGFVRHQDFHGMTVESYSEVCARLDCDDFIILIALAACTDELLGRIYTLSRTHPVYAPDFDVFSARYPDADFLKTNCDLLRQVYALLSDDRSRQAFQTLCHYKLTGAVDGLFSCHDGRTDCLRELLPLHSHERYVDLGAYRGDTLEEFLDLTGGRYDAISLFEPDPRNMKKLRELVESLDLPHAALYEGAVSDHTGALTFTGKGGRASHLTEGIGYTVQTHALDDLPGLRPTYIKMDVEGAEEAALRGMQKTLRLHRPMLAVSLYHRLEDYFTLPLLIDRLTGGEYQYYLRMHPYIPAWDVLLYAVPKERLSHELDTEKL